MYIMSELRLDTEDVESYKPRAKRQEPRGKRQEARAKRQAPSAGRENVDD